MADKTLDLFGLPVATPKADIGKLTISVGKQAWDRLAALKNLWEAERNQRLSITDAVRACIYLAHKLVMESTVTLASAPPADPPLEQQEEAQPAEEKPDFAAIGSQARGKRRSRK